MHTTHNTTLYRPHLTLHQTTIHYHFQTTIHYSVATTLVLHNIPHTKVHNLHCIPQCTHHNHTAVGSVDASRGRCMTGSLQVTMICGYTLHTAQHTVNTVDWSVHTAYCTVHKHTPCCILKDNLPTRKNNPESPWQKKIKETKLNQEEKKKLKNIYIQGGSFTIYDLWLTTYDLRLTTTIYHLTLITYYYPLTSYHLQLNFYHFSLTTYHWQPKFVWPIYEN